MACHATNTLLEIRLVLSQNLKISEDLQSNLILLVAAISQLFQELRTSSQFISVLSQLSHLPKN